MSMMLTIEHLSKSYAGRPALEDVNLSIESDAIVGLFGRNGAGKSTLMSCIANRLLPSSGRIVLDGKDVRDNEHAQQRIYLVNETLPFLICNRLGGFFRNEERFAGGFDWDFATRMLAGFGIEPTAQFGTLSFGQRMMVRLAAALAVPADVVLLDEPMLGLDPVNRDLFYRFLLQAYAERPRLIMLSTHIIDEIAPVIERVVILDHRHIADNFASDELAERATIISGPAAEVEAFADRAALPAIHRETMGVYASVTLRGSVARAAVPETLFVDTPSLKDYVVQLTSKED